MADSPPHSEPHWPEAWETLQRCWGTDSTALPDDLRQRAQALMDHWNDQPCLIAFSGGVDSSLVAALLTLATRNPVRLVTAVGPALALRQRHWVQKVAQYLGTQVEWIDAGEIDVPGYQANGSDRCYYCKSQLYDSMRLLADRAQQQDTLLVNGTNLDDLGDHRPGLLAAGQRHVRSPLVEAGFGKQEVRLLAGRLQLPVWDLPASPCLASRIQYGTTVTAERLKIVEQAEDWLWQNGFSDGRVRLLEGDRASVEVPVAEVQRLDPSGPLLKDLQRTLTMLGFQQVQVASDGLKSGRLNQLLPGPGRQPLPGDGGGPGARP